MLDATLQVLWDFHDREDRTRIKARAHVANAVASVLARAGDPGDQGRIRLCAALARGDDRHAWPLGVSAAQALGVLCEGRPDTAVEAALGANARHGRNRHARGFARLALGRIGSESALRWLLAELTGSPDDFHQPWAALALGMALRLPRRDAPLGADLRAEVGASLLATLGDDRDRSFGVRAMALGLGRHRAAIPFLIAGSSDGARNPNAIVDVVQALALMDAPEAITAFDASARLRAAPGSSKSSSSRAPRSAIPR